MEAPHSLSPEKAVVTTSQESKIISPVLVFYHWGQGNLPILDSMLQINNVKAIAQFV